jgi:hypothetical protein
VYSLRRQGDAIEGDSYYGKQGKSSAILHTPAGDKTFDHLTLMFSEIEVDGKKVTGKTFDIKGELMEEFTLAPPPAVKPGAEKPKAKPAVEPGKTPPGVDKADKEEDDEADETEKSQPKPKHKPGKKAAGQPATAG